LAEQLQDRLIRASQKIQQRIGQFLQLQKIGNELLLQHQQASERLKNLIEGKTLLELYVKSTDKKTRQKFEPIITEALHIVFSQDLYFHLYLVNRRNQTEIDFIILRSGLSEKAYQEYIETNNEKELEKLVKETKNILYMYGGAVNQVLSLVLRFIIAELLKIKGPIALDEPSSAVGEEYSSRLGQLISSLSTKYNRQYIYVTHSKSLASFAERAYNVKQENYISYIEELN
jgi:ABC-type lipoprotein export system ATPase subunit